MDYTLHLQKVVKKKEKKTKTNNLCITSLKSYERGGEKIHRKRKQDKQRE
jgi:hypothetical protein